MRSIEHTLDTSKLKLILDEVKDSEVFDRIDGVWFLLYSNKKLAGIINLHPINNVLWVPHILIFEEYRGEGSEKWGKLVARFMRKNLGAKKFLVLTPFERAKRYAEKVGFKYITVLSNSVEKDGKLLYQYMLELGDEE